MKLRFLGAATTVTGSQFLLTTRTARVIVDCGMFQGSPHEAARNRLPLGYDPRAIDAFVITHAHLDHCGLVPVPVREGYVGPIYLTHATAELASLVLLDSAKVQMEQAKERARRERRRARERDPDDARPRVGPATDALEPAAMPQAAPEGVDEEASIRRQPPAIETDLSRPLYDVDAAQAAIDRFVPRAYGEAFVVAPGVTATLHDAGHILGSAIVVLDVEEDSASRRIVFSGDLGRPGTPIIRDPTAIVGGADVVVVESTYGGREHAPAEEARRALADAVRVVAEGHGVLLVPAFAIGRTQEIVWELDRLLEAGAIPHVPLYLDSPMASHASDIYRRHPDHYDEETRRLLETGASPLDYPGQEIVRDARQSRSLPRAPRPLMIVASSGMLTGGRVVAHLRELIDDPAALLLFVGYQGEGTLGAHLQAGAREVWLDGAVRQVRCSVRSISGFSAHADESELVDWMRAFATATLRPRAVFLVHGDPEAAMALEPRVRELGLPTFRPSFDEEVELP
jgi:metallo-beta-lactamase family protein